jgi:hypothetical protein
MKLHLISLSVQSWFLNQRLNPTHRFAIIPSTSVSSACQINFSYVPHIYCWFIWI